MQESSPAAPSGASSRSIYEQYIDRSWRAWAERARGRGPDFVVGRREGPYVWDLEGDRRLLDCAVGGGVHSLGHRNPEVLAALRRAIGEDGLDGGLWTFPSVAMLGLQDALAATAPHPSLDRSVITLGSTASIDLAIQMVSLLTGKQRVAAYRHGYHGHAGFAAMVTGSREEGIIDYYGQPNPVASFFEPYGDLDAVAAVLDDGIGAVILEPFDYETWIPASADYLLGVRRLCDERGALLIVDETRTGLGRSGRMWMCELTGVVPDMLITGKGLSGGFYPVSAVLTTAAIHNRCINGHPFAFASSLGGNEIACTIGQAVLGICGSEALKANVAALSARFAMRFGDLCDRYPEVYTPGTVCGGIATIGVVNPDDAPAIAAHLFGHGVLCHSISLVDPVLVKFFPVLTADPAIADEVAAALGDAAARAAS
ncbi:MAG: aminotransferase class III-fold pyridoxal phosphate-dependent enzyme [Thermomicrobiales bacterium]